MSLKCTTFNRNSFIESIQADSSCTRDDRRERIVAECNAVRQALQDLLSEYMSNMGKKDRSEGLDRALDHMCRKTRDLRRQLRKAVVDHVSDSFLETNVPLLVLIEAAKSGNEKEVEEYSQVCFHKIVVFICSGFAQINFLFA
jgi:catenin alpha